MPRDRLERLMSLRQEIEARLEALMADLPYDTITLVVRDALLGPGQRLRPMLLLLAARECGGSAAAALDLACALEMVHAASLVIDDLPVMDDASERRGRPALHLVHGPAEALLGAIALLSRAFSVVSRLPGADAAQRAALGGRLATLVDTMVSGQIDELRCPAAPQRGATALQALQDRSLRKTAAAFVSAVELATALAPHAGDRRSALMCFAEHLGQAYQIDDDLRDASADGDRDTYATLLDRRAAQQLLKQHLAAARAQLPRTDSALGSFAATLFADAWAHAA